MTNLTGHTLDNGYIPHERETWKYIYAKVKEPMEMRHFTGSHNPEGPIFDVVKIEKGTTVKIVMASRFGDVGITENLEAENGYGARVSMDALYDYSETLEAV